MKRKQLFRTVRICLLILLLSCGCSAKIAGQETEAAKSEKSETTVSADSYDIPEDGIIKASIFETFAGMDKNVSFHGTSPEGISYTWIYSGINIQNPQDVNLKVSFLTKSDDMQEAVEAAGNPPYILGMELHDEGQITIPELKIELNEKWNAEAPIFCTEQDKAMAKVCDVTVTEEKGHTVLQMKVSVSGITGYVMAGEKASEAENESQLETETGTETLVAFEDGQTQQETQEDGVEKNTQDDGSSQSSDQGNTESTCTFSISCSSILNNLDDLKEGKEEFVPANGYIFEPSIITFTAGDSVFDVLQSVCQQYGIHMEHSYTPAYGSEYIEGINQLYEFDCGELSGWMYSVNGWFPNYGCDQYTVEDGDTIQWVYTCDLGRDVGDNSNWN